MIEATTRTRPGATAVLALALAAACSGGPARLADLPTGTLAIEGADGATEVRVWIAEDDASRVAGLRHVEELAEDRGMVFLHPEGTRSRFTMDDTLVPLSLAAWGNDHRIAVILEMVPCRSEPCPIYDPGVEWVGAVEVNRGFFERNGVAVGDRVSLER